MTLLYLQPCIKKTGSSEHAAWAFADYDLLQAVVSFFAD
jgi:hypothetical protein